MPRRVETVETRRIIKGVVEGDLARVLQALHRVDVALGPLQGMEGGRRWRKFIRIIKRILGRASRNLDDVLQGGAPTPA